MKTPNQCLADLLEPCGIDASALDSLQLSGSDPVLPSSFRVGTAAQCAIAAVGAAVADLHHLRTGTRQDLSVDMRHAAAEFRSERHLRKNGEPYDIWDNLSGAFRCGDGRWLRLHMLLPHHCAGVLSILQCEPDKTAIAKALLGWEAEAFETRASDDGLVVAMMRSLAEWDNHPEAKAVARMAPVTITRIGSAPARQLPPATRPLEGVRVLDLTRIIAGPLCGRTLAAHGAEVLYVTAPHLPFSLPFVVDFGRGKRSAQIDLTTTAGSETLRGLLGDTDVFLQSYRPGTLAARGFGPQEAAEIRPGIVYVSLSAYSLDGPWKNKRGFDSLVQTATGINHAEAEALGQEAPLPLPCQVLDHASGYFMALGVLAALKQRAEQGGSWHVQVSLAATGHWMRSLGRIPGGHACPDPDHGAVAPFLDSGPSGFGDLTWVRHAARLSATPPQWSIPAVPLGTHAAEW